MYWSRTLIPTMKETPSDAEIVSHQLLLRAGLVRKLTGGLYTFLPLGLRVLRKVEKIVREEMDRAGALEVLMPALQPPEIWQKSGRYETAADVLFKVRDRAKKEWVLGPTHEEVITTLVAGEINSYRQMPKNFYQIQTKFRDEIRPRFGLMRAKEFIMKDAYSFDADDEGAQVELPKDVRRLRAHFRPLRVESDLPVEAEPASSAANIRTSSWCPPRRAKTKWSIAKRAITRPTSRRPPAASQDRGAASVGAAVRKICHARRRHDRSAVQGAIQSRGPSTRSRRSFTSPTARSVSF